MFAQGPEKHEYELGLHPLPVLAVRQRSLDVNAAGRFLPSEQINLGKGRIFLTADAHRAVGMHWTTAVLPECVCMNVGVMEDVKLTEKTRSSEHTCPGNTVAEMVRHKPGDDRNYSLCLEMAPGRIVATGRLRLVEANSLFQIAELHVRNVSSTGPPLEQRTRPSVN